MTIAPPAPSAIREDAGFVDPVTVAGLALCLLPLLTVWHEIGGHASTCLLLGGRLRTVGAFYVDCVGLDPAASRHVACAGPLVDAVIAAVALLLLRRGLTSGLALLTLFYVFTVKSFAASGYLIFSGATGLGDFGIERGAALSGLSHQAAWRCAALILGVALYYLSYRAAARALSVMVGRCAGSGSVRRRIARLYYIVAGVDAVVVGLCNPVGLRITLLSAAASSLGAGVGLVSLGFAGLPSDLRGSLEVRRRWDVLVVGMAVSVLFAVTLGRSLRFEG